MMEQTKTLYKKVFTPETWESLDVVIDGLGYGKTIQDILEEKYEIIVEDPKKTLEINSIRILEQRIKELLEKGKLNKLRNEVIALEHKQLGTISKEQKEINELKQKIQEINGILTDQESNLAEITRLKVQGNKLKKKILAYCLDVPHRKEFIESIKF